MKTGLVIIGGMLLLGSFGCAPRLAQTQLGDEELRWQKHIKKSYPAWKPPQTAPPAIAGNIAPVANNNDVDIVLETEMKTVTEPEALYNEAASSTSIPLTPTTPVKSKSYTVQKGDTLSAISVKMYNTSNEVERIIGANRDIIKDKNKIHPGMILVIPNL